MMKELKLHWAGGVKGVRKNFGDWLSPYLCERFSGRPVVYAKHNKCDLIAVGSILQRVKNGRFRRKVHVWGSGFIENRGRVKSYHYYHAVRGYKTASLLKDQQIRIYGDPGLLCDLLVPDYHLIAKQYALGVIPHYKDQLNPIVQTFAEKNPNVQIIDVFSEVEKVLRQVASCEFVLSSSLHGLIAADAFEIPNAWVQLSDKIRGQNFKFHDYYSVFGIDSPLPTILKADTSLQDIMQLADTYKRPNLKPIKQQLLGAFPFPKSREL